MSGNFNKSQKIQTTQKEDGFNGFVIWKIMSSFAKSMSIISEITSTFTVLKKCFPDTGTLNLAMPSK